MIEPSVEGWIWTTSVPIATWTVRGIANRKAAAEILNEHFYFLRSDPGSPPLRTDQIEQGLTGFELFSTLRPAREFERTLQAVETFFVRMGDVLSAAFVFVGTTWLGLEVSGFAAGNILLVGIWIGVAFLILREYKRLKGTGAEVGQE